MSSRARVWVGSVMPTYRRLPRLNSGSTWCFCSSSSLTSLSALWAGSKALTSSSGMPNSMALAAANWLGATSFFSPIQCASGTLALAASVIALRAVLSSMAPSRTRRRAMPVMPTRLAVLATAAFIETFPGLAWYPGC